MTLHNPVHSEVDRHIRVDVLDFDSEQGVDTFLDQKHKVKHFFKMYEVYEVRKFQFAESKLKGIAWIWWNNYKKGMSKFGNGIVTT